MDVPEAQIAHKAYILKAYTYVCIQCTQKVPENMVFTDKSSTYF